MSGPRARRVLVFCVAAARGARKSEAAAGQWDSAEEHYQIALRPAREPPVVIERPEVRRWYAPMLIDRAGPGDPSTGSGQDRDRAR